MGDVEKDLLVVGGVVEGLAATIHEITCSNSRENIFVIFPTLFNPCVTIVLLVFLNCHQLYPNVLGTSKDCTPKDSRILNIQ